FQPQGEQMSEIKVYVVEFSNRRYYQMRYRDPESGRKFSRSTGVERTGRKRERAEAEKSAGKWQAELLEGRYAKRGKVTWAAFRERYEDEVLADRLADTTDVKVAGVFNAVESILKPAKLRELTADAISRLETELRKRGRAESTIKGHLAHLKAALRWAARMGMIPAAPAIEMPKRAKGSTVMKGRPITGEEFDRMLAKVKAALSTVESQRTGKARPWKLSEPKRLELEQRAVAAVPSWQHLLRGLWWSGLRLGESLELSWDDAGKLCIDLDGKRPMLRIPAELEKGNKDRVLPLAPEFAEFLMATPEHERTGYVFNPRPQRMERSTRLSVGTVARVLSDIGKAAGVKVSTSGKVKFASAHDLRRSFGERWAARVMPQLLMVLMRHESIDTTMRYYVGRNAQTAADVLWEAHAKATGNQASGITLGITGHDSTHRAEAGQAASTDAARAN
ncbi:MAG: site-specific integrase, partial [Pirellulales bacterium]